MTEPLTMSYWAPRTDGTPLDVDITVGELLRQVAAEGADRLALVEGIAAPGVRRRWTFGSLLSDAERCARALSLRFQRGERIAVWASNSPEWVILEYGAAMAGLILVAINPSNQPGELAYALRKSRAAGIFLVSEVRGNPLMAHLTSVRKDLPELQSIFLLDRLGDLMAEADLGGVAETVELPDVRGDDAAQIQFSSGTTGAPKGAVLRHASIVNNSIIWSHRVGVPEGASWLSPMPLFHTAGCVHAVLGSANRRATLVLMDAFEPGAALELIESERAWFFAGVPTMLIAMIEHPDYTKRDLSSLTSVLSGGSQVPEALVRRIEDSLGVDFTVIYGQTECSPGLTNTLPSDNARDKGTTVGPPLPHTELQITDPETMETVGVGCVGELWARGYMTMQEYFENPEATSETLLADGWLRTGDLATMDDRGYCRIVGRLKDMIIRGGENLFPAEIEQVLYRHDGVADVAVVGLPDERWGEVAAAFVRPADPDAPPTQAELRALVRSHLSPQKTPGAWLWVDALPQTGSGKVQKFALRDAWLAGDLRRELPLA